MEYILRLEALRDYREVEMLTYNAFVDLELPGREFCDEHFLVHKMRDVPAFVRELDYVAKKAGEIIGNIMYTKNKVVSLDGTEHEVLSFGPVSVLPKYQRSGVGSALINKTIDEARSLGYKAILIFGHPEYYPRFGFRNAKNYGIKTADGKNFDAFMALELYNGALDGIKGKLHLDPVFETDAEDLAEYNRLFFGKDGIPKKELSMK